MFNVALLSRWHCHGLCNRYVDDLKKIPDAKIIAVWDEVPERGKKWADELGVKFVADLDELLVDPELNGVVITAPTDMHHDIIMKCAKARKHIFTEKAFALDNTDACEMREEIKKDDITFRIAFPRRSNPEYVCAKKLYREGVLGEISLMRVRNGFDVRNIGGMPDYWFRKEHTGGGVMIDLGCHLVDLVCDLIGKRPETASAVFTNLRGNETEDGAVGVLTFDGRKTAAIIDTTLNSPPREIYTLEIYGTKANFLARDGKVEISYLDRRPDEVIPFSELKGDKSPIEKWIEEANGVWFYGDCNADTAVLLTEVMTALYRSDAERREIMI